MSTGMTTSFTPSSYPEVECQQEYLATTTAGLATYLLPMGAYFWGAGSAGTAMTLEINKGSGYSAANLGTDFNYLCFRPGVFVTGGASDMGLGIALSGTVPAGWALRFKWKRRQVLIRPEHIAPVHYTGTAPDYTVKTRTGKTALVMPTGVTVQLLTGYQIEFWRRTKHNAGPNVNSHAPAIGMGKRFIPYYRAPLGTVNFPASAFAAASAATTRYYKICYYNPSTGARSALSEQTIVKFRAHGTRNDTRSHTLAGYRTKGALWIK